MAKKLDFVKPEDKEAVEKILADYPQLSEDKSAELQARIDSMLKDYNDWKTWYDGTYPLFQAMEADNVKLKTQVAEFEAGKGKNTDALRATADKAAADAAAAAAGANKTPDAKSLDEALAKLQAGFISKSEFDELKKGLSEEILKAARDGFWKDIYPGMSNTLLGINESGARFTSEFPSEKWDRSDFLKFAKDNNISDVSKAYDAYVSDRRQKAAIQTAVDKALADERAKNAQQSIPGSAPARPQDLGLLERRARNVKPEVELPANAQLGSGQMARLAAEELRREGKTDLDTSRGTN